MRRERIGDLIINLFKDYSAAKDKEFVTCIQKKKGKCDEGDDALEEKLMILVLKKGIRRKKLGE